MKKNGFIATSLIYSFFLVFCALVVSYVTLNVSNKVLLRREIEEIKDEINGSNNLKDVQVGTYIKISLKNELITDFNTVEYIIVKKDANYVYVMPVVDIINAYKATGSITTQNFKDLVSKEVKDPTGTASCYTAANILPIDNVIKGELSSNTTTSKYLRELLLLENTTLIGYISSTTTTANISYFNLETNANGTAPTGTTHYTLRAYVKISTKIGTNERKIYAGDGTKGSPYLVEGCAYV